LDFLSELTQGNGLVAAELRPPRATLGPKAGMEAWIDTYHAIEGLARLGTYSFLTDGAVGKQEEDNLRHLIANLGDDISREQIVPFLTTKHTLNHCLQYADRAWETGFRSLVVLGGDTTVGTPRVVPHGSDLRQLIRKRQPKLKLGGWANPHANISNQVDFLLEKNITANFFLTQVVSHHDRKTVERFVTEARQRELTLPGVFGVFFYRSASIDTLESLGQFLPVPAAHLSAEFEAGLTAVQICARSIAMLRDVGVSNIYVSNLPVGRATSTLKEILSEAEQPTG